MRITYDADKRALTLQKRGLDFADAGQVFDSPHSTKLDVRQDYAELRFQTMGLIDGDVVFLVRTPRGDAVRVISMRRAKERERDEYRERMG